MMLGEPAPDWLMRDNTLAGLAGKVGINPEGLQATVERFNRLAAEGVDPDFHRGESAYDRHNGDPTHKSIPGFTRRAPPWLLGLGTTEPGAVSG